MTKEQVLLFDRDADLALKKFIESTSRSEGALAAHAGYGSMVASVPPPPGDGPLPFVDIVSVDPQYVAAAVWLSRRFVPAIRENLEIDFDKAHEIIDGDQRLEYAGSNDVEISHPSAQVRAIVDLHVSRLTSSLPTEGSLRDKIVAAVTSTFTNLATQQTSSWLFWQTETAQSTTYLYDMLFAVQNTQTAGAMVGLILSWIISVDVRKERLLGITINDTQSYAVRLRSLRVAMRL